MRIVITSWTWRASSRIAAEAPSYKNSESTLLTLSSFCIWLPCFALQYWGVYEAHEEVFLASNSWWCLRSLHDRNNWSTPNQICPFSSIPLMADDVYFVKVYNILDIAELQQLPFRVALRRCFLSFPTFSAEENASLFFSSHLCASFLFYST